MNSVNESIAEKDNLSDPSCTQGPEKLLRNLILEVGKAQDLDEALEAVIRIVCHHQQWLYGEAWQFSNEANTLIKHPAWYRINQGNHTPSKNNTVHSGPPRKVTAHQPSIGDARGGIDSHATTHGGKTDDSPAKTIQFKQFKQLSERYTFELGSGIPGRVWLSQQAEWHSDVSQATTAVFTRNEEAARCGVRAALGVPLVACERTLAVLVFFSDEAIPENSQLVDNINAISIPIGMLVQQRQAEKALRDSEEKLATEKELAQVTLQCIGDAVISTDATDSVQYLNPAAEALTGWPQADAIGQPLGTVFKVVHEKTRQSIIGQLLPESQGRTQSRLRSHTKSSVDKMLKPVCKECLSELSRGNAGLDTFSLENVGLDEVNNRIDQTANHTLLIARNGYEFLIEVSVAPLQTDDGRSLGTVIVFHDISSTQQLSRQLSWQSSHDTITGLLNRREFERRIIQAVDNAHTHSKRHALCYLDLDNFRIVNDTCGHQAGDRLLEQVGTLLRQQIRSADTLARLGGDEFGLLLEYCPLDNAGRVIHELREKLKTLKFACKDRAFSVTASVGITAIGAETESAAAAMNNVETACHIAKRKGRNRIHVHQLDDAELAQQRGEIQWAAYITEALETGQFRLYYQSILSLNPEDPDGEHYEVLLRLRDQNGELVSPTQFMPAAERYNLMPLVDRWVVKTLFSSQAAHYQRVWARLQDKEQVCGGHLYAINLSGASINDDEFMHFLKAQFEKYQIPPALICFEITETAAIANLDQAALFIKELRKLGCQFSLDDFGSGMSSFAYLKALPVDYLKIDGRFIQNIVDDEIDTAMVTAIHQMAEVMNIRTVAEFVENEDILKLLQGLGISYAQGYGIAKPAPLSASLG